MRQGLLMGFVAAFCFSAAHADDGSTGDSVETGPDPGFLEQYGATYRFRLGQPNAIRVTPNGKSVLFLRSGPRSFVRDLWELDVESGTERVVLTADGILGGTEERLTAAEKARRERQRLVARGIASYLLSEDGSRILVPLSGRLYVVERPGLEVRELDTGEGTPLDPQLSPDGRWVAYVLNGELHALRIARGKPRKLTSGAGEHVTNGLAEFVAQEEMRRYHGFWWSPDSKRIAYQRTDTTGLEVMNIGDATHPDRPPDRWPYPRPGKMNADVRLAVVPVKGGSTTWVEWDREGFEYLANVRWQKNAPLTILVQNRKQTEQRLLAVGDDGSTEILVVERDDAWVEIDPSMPRWLPDGGGFLWTTERGGGKQLEIRNRDGSLRATVTEPELGWDRLVRHLPDAGVVIATTGSNPTETQVWRIPLDASGGERRRLTAGRALHDAVSNAEGTTMVVMQAPFEGAPRWEVWRNGERTGTEVRSVMEQPPFEPNVELTTVGSDPSFHVAIVRPRSFVPGRKYPVIDHVYGGPTSLMVRASAHAYLLDQWIADHGYVVVRIDGRGTPGRGRDWNRVVKHDLIEVPLADQVAALRLLGERYAEIDLSRVGIYGWSFGGYFAAMAVMREPEIFRAGVAGAPVVDWADYDTHYTERYLDLPQDNEDGYRDSNVLTWAGELSRPLLLIHGTADDNVYFVHSLKLADALFRAGKEFDFLPLAGFTHAVPDPNVTLRLNSRIVDFFETHVRGDAKRP